MSDDVLSEVRRLATQGRIKVSLHVSAHRAYRFGGDVRHIEHALKNASSIRPSGKEHTSDWVVTGPDRDGDDLDLAIIVDGDVIVVTVF